MFKNGASFQGGPRSFPHNVKPASEENSQEFSTQAIV